MFKRVRKAYLKWKAKRKIGLINHHLNWISTHNGTDEAYEARRMMEVYQSTLNRRLDNYIKGKRES